MNAALTESARTTGTGFERDLALAFPGPAGTAPDEEARLRLLRRLHAHYVAYLAGPADFAAIPRLNTDPEIGAIERAWLGAEEEIAGRAELPRTAAEFHPWFLRTAADHVQPEFNAYLAEEATLAEIALFFMAEELVDSRFDDLMALVQIGAEGRTKLTIAENYWDEMGEGVLDRMHTRMFEHSAVYMRAHLDGAGVDRGRLHLPEVYANASLLLAYGVHRHLNPRALGAMGVLEQSASPRFQAMVDGCARLGVPEDVIAYQRIHVHVDADHGAEWTEGVFLPLVARSPELLREISLGVVTRVRIADAYYRRIWELMRGVR
ncbi:iron-containing redox enzyme family protein [Actinomadura parmotrematis]|uniref:Iron-containing redox enzyme family protein n=1 Tax=Actinomadura parmotrematis TaxID=2864039 RepID=A0ABS7G3K7_9ACTN|nr:iron-containing redox enzyme family protein [Actinomadura parmotrematis]MBW8486810.1 iron-containing redox enzyme family protein [Actinomadura parmotrematis]